MCVKRFYMIRLMAVLLISFGEISRTTYDEYGFISMVFYGQNYVALLRGSGISAELHSRNFILGINCFTISTLNV